MHHDPPVTARQPGCGRRGETPTVVGGCVKGGGGFNGSESSALPGAGRGTGWEDWKLGDRQTDKEETPMAGNSPPCSSDRGSPSLCFTAPWPPSWFPEEPGVTWSP